MYLEHGFKYITTLTRFCDLTKKKSIQRHCQCDIGGPSVLCQIIAEMPPFGAVFWLK